MRKTWDIFCCVIDNYGDIGVTWRLARQLVSEFNISARLWVDDLNAFGYLCPEVKLELAQQTVQGVEINYWPVESSFNWQSIIPADLVIEAFGCQLPLAYLESMSSRNPQSLWINLEYLSAEDWVQGCHGLMSPQSNLTDKYFFFPGFTKKTGGLIREKNLIERCQQFQNNPKEKQAFLNSIGVIVDPKDYLISLFAYENPSLANWLDGLVLADSKTHILVPKGRIVADVLTWLDITEAEFDAQPITKGSLKIQLIPFLSQDNYDRLLWSCDFNCVRGEDSFVRAQWAAKPFLWHIYPQQENVHLDKLAAFIKIYTQQLKPASALAFSALWQAWNNGLEMQQAWQNTQQIQVELEKNAENWCFDQANQRNIAESLVEFYQNWLK